MCRDDAGVGSPHGPTATSRDHLAVGDDWPGTMGCWLRGVVENLGFPDEVPRDGIEGEGIVVGAGVNDESVVNGEIAIRCGQASYKSIHIFWQFAPVFPLQVTSGGINRLNEISRVGHVEGALVDEWRALLASLPERPCPRKLKTVHILRGDLVQRAVTPTIERSAPHEPVGGCGVLEHRVGDDHEFVFPQGLGGGGVR